jgi:menaquinol-cytochrome c reductase iron-sulfur subunit
MTKHLKSDPISPERRKFLTTSFGLIGGLVAVFMSWPLVSFLLGEKDQGREDAFVKVPNFPQVPLNKPTKLTFGFTQQQAFLAREEFNSIWVIKHSDDAATVYSPICTHLSCQYGYNEGEKRFDCPCHGSIFDLNGKVLGGPAARPLDRLPYKIDGGELYVKWKMFKPGIP